MRLNRFSLVAGILALGVAACGDDVEVVQPTPPQPPPPPALSASMAPASAEVMVGSSVVFAVNASGGVVGEAASWTCASSNTGIATVSVTSAGCQATGVAAGGVTITASVSKSGETANVGAQLTVTSPAAPPPFEASIAPESQSVAVGSSVVFAVNTSGGYTGMMMGGNMMAASWTCSSSDPAIATVETTDAGCQATGVSGGEVTINVAATDSQDTINLVAQLTVTTDPVDPVQPFSASMAPESAEIAVGSNAVFAINTSGGAADATASWACSSSDEAVATASTTEAGCEATGVAGGGVTINAAVTKGDDSANLASRLTVTAPDVGDPAFILIARIEDENRQVAEEDGTLAGRVEVDISLDRGDQTLESLSLLVGDEVVATQPFVFGPAASPAAAQSGGNTITMSFESDSYSADGVPAYLNGDHVISAQLALVDAETVLSNAVTVEFDNEDFIGVSIAGLGDGVMNPTSGQVWYGGPDVDPEITATPVYYTAGRSLASLTLLSFCGADAQTKDEAPYTFDVECKSSFEEAAIPTFTVGGDDITTKTSEIHLDFKAPVAPHFNVNPYGREDGWVNPTVDFLGEFHATRNKNGWLNYNDDDDAAGVGGYHVQLRFSTTTPSIVDGAREAAPNVLPTAPTRANAACVIATAVDLLGNESSLPSAGSDCVTTANYAADADGDYPGGLRAGLDVTAPTIEFSPASPRADASSLKEFQLQVADPGATSTGRSGLHSIPVISKVEARDADNDVLCGDDDDVRDGGVGGGGQEQLNGDCNLFAGMAFNDPLATTSGLTSVDAEGYYTFTAVAQDKAGNRSEEVVRTAAHDDEDPELGLIVGGYDKGAWSVTATLTDNLSLKSYWAEVTDEVSIGGATPSVIILPREGSVAVDEYNSPDLTQSLLTTPPVTMQTYRALQDEGPGDDAAVATIDAIRVVATDQGGEWGQAENALVTTSPTTGVDQFGRQTATTFAADAADVAYERDEVFQSFTVIDDESDDDVLELRATIAGTVGYEDAVAAVADDPLTTDVDETVDAENGTEGLVNNPVSRVDFYVAVALDGDPTNDVPPDPDGPGTEALVFLGSANAAGAEDFLDADNGDAPSRRYVWGLDMSGADVVEAAGGDGGVEYTFVAIAVNSDGVAITDDSPATTVDD